MESTAGCTYTELNPASRQNLQPLQVAERLWKLFLNRCGVDLICGAVAPIETIEQWNVSHCKHNDIETVTPLLFLSRHGKVCSNTALDVC